MALAWYGFHRELVIFLTCTQLCECNAIICWNWHDWSVFFIFQVQARTGLSGERPDSPLCSQCWFMWCQVFIWDESKEKHTTFLLRPAQEKYGKHYYLIDWQVKALKVLSTYDVTWNQGILFIFINFSIQSHVGDTTIVNGGEHLFSSTFFWDLSTSALRS